MFPGSPCFCDGEKKLPRLPAATVLPHLSIKMDEISNSENTNEFITFYEGAAKDDRSNHLMAAITNSVIFLRKNPFPEVMNRTFNLLAGVFCAPKSHSDANLIRYRIVVLARECRPFIHSYHTSEIMLRTMMQVSHSNDSDAQALSLLLLAAMAPVMYTHSLAHHIILESIGSSVSVVKHAAVIAAQEFSKLSREFCDILIPKISDLLLSFNSEVRTKVHLMATLTHFKDGVELCDQSTEIGLLMLKNNFDKEVFIAAYDLLTRVALKRGMVADHVLFMLEELEKSCDDPMLFKHVMKNLAVLSKTSQWTTELVKMFIEKAHLTFESKSDDACRYFLIALFNFMSEGRFSESVTAASVHIYPFLSSNDFDVAVMAAKIVVKLDNDEFAASTLFNFISVLIMRMPGQLIRSQKTLCRVIADFCASPVSSDSDVAQIVEQLMSRMDPGCSSFDLILETLNAVCNRTPRLFSLVATFAWKVLEHHAATSRSSDDQPKLLKPSIHLISLLLAPQFARSSDAPCLGTFVTEYAEKLSFGFRYHVAQMAFRFGHWREVAVPFLAAVPRHNVPLIYSDWLQALNDIALSQPVEFTVKELSASSSHLRKACLMLNVLCSHAEKGHLFNFASQFTDILAKTVFLVKDFLALVNTNDRLLANQSVYVQRSIATQCLTWVKESDRLRLSLDDLMRMSFDADRESMAQIFLIRQLYDIIYFGFDYLTSKMPQPLSNPFGVHTESSTNAHLHELICWARNQLSKLALDEPWKVRIKRECVHLIREVFVKLLTGTFFLPRAFFHLVHSTKIRLKVNVPGGREKEPYRYIVKSFTKHHPIVVEGFIDTNNPAGIKYVLVKGVGVYPRNGNSDNTPVVQQRSITLERNANHFEANFLFTVPTSATLRFSITFIDKISYKSWQSDAQEEVYLSTT